MSTVLFPGLGFAINVKEVAFHIFGWPIYWYGLIIALGFVLAVAYCSLRSARFGIKQDDIIDLLIFAVPLCIIGARLYYIIFYLDLYRDADGNLDFARMIRIWDGGLAIYGCIIVAVIVAAVFCKVKKIRFWALADLGVFGLLIGQMVGRWGNFVNVEAYGSVTDLPWRMGIYDWVDGVYQYLEVHPTFLYESLWNLMGFVLLAIVAAKFRKYDGQIFFGYVAWYGLGRAWIEGLRSDSLYLFSTGLRVSQVLAIVTCIGAVCVLIYEKFRSHTPDQLWVNQVAVLEAEQIAEKPVDAEEIKGIEGIEGPAEIEAGEEQASDKD